MDADKPRLASLIASSTVDEPPQQQGNSSNRRRGDPSSGEEEEGEETEQEKQSCSSGESGDEIVKAGSRSRRGAAASSPSSSSSSSEDLDLELGLGQNGEIVDDEVKQQLHLGSNAEEERDCRICHLSLDDAASGNEDSGYPIDLGCSCKDDLAAAHKHCAEAWFKIKGNKTCEICGSVARNVAGATELETVVEQWNEGSDEVEVAPSAAAAAAAGQPAGGGEGGNGGRHFWQGHRFLNFLLACMVFAFVISWLFHFNVPS